jgi:hypothetical protein
MPGFGRRYSPDDRDRNFLMRRMLSDPRAVSLPTRKTWRINSTALDQGQTGTCVGQAWRNFLRCAPMQLEKGGPSPYSIYREAVKRDPWADNDDEASLPDRDPGMDSGTSVRAGAQALESMGHLRSYVWAFELQPAIEWVLTTGPVVLGTNWYSSFRPDEDGVVRITPTATPIGGHAYLWRGADTKRALALCSNSWGEAWGKSGEFYLPFRDLERLIHENGEACSAIQRRLEGKASMPAPATAFDAQPRARDARRRSD